MSTVNGIDLTAGDTVTDQGSCIDSPDDLLLHPVPRSKRKCVPSSPLYLGIAACMAALGGVLFGYDVGESIA